MIESIRHEVSNLITGHTHMPYALLQLPHTHGPPYVEHSDMGVNNLIVP